MEILVSYQSKDSFFWANGGFGGVQKMKMAKTMRV